MIIPVVGAELYENMQKDEQEDDMMKGILGNMFDVNRDGKLDSFERGIEYQFLDAVSQEENVILEDADDECPE